MRVRHRPPQVRKSNNIRTVPAVHWLGPLTGNSLQIDAAGSNPHGVVVVPFCIPFVCFLSFFLFRAMQNKPELLTRSGELHEDTRS